jgi:hypothetical protein
MYGVSILSGFIQYRELCSVDVLQDPVVPTPIPYSQVTSIFLFFLTNCQIFALAHGLCVVIGDADKFGLELETNVCEDESYMAEGSTLLFKMSVVQRSPHTPPRSNKLSCTVTAAL